MEEEKDNVLQNLAALLYSRSVTSEQLCKAIKEASDIVKGLTLEDFSYVHRQKRLSSKQKEAT